MGRRIRHLVVGLGAALVFGAVGVGVSAIGQTTWRVTINGPDGAEHVYEVSAESEGEARDAAWAELRAESSTTVRSAPSESCEATLGGDPFTASIPACAVVSTDMGQSPDPEQRWGKIDCASDSRVSQAASGGDPHPTATGKLQEDSAYRRLTVFDGDDVSGERCELGRNEHRYGSDGGDGTFQLYREGQRRITFVSFRLPENFHMNHSSFQNVLQMKQTQPSDNGSCPPELTLQVRDGEWWLQHASSAGPCGDSDTLWKAPAQAGVWVRMALDVTYSQDSEEGKVKLYLDRNGDGDSLDADERSPTFTTHTLKYETPDPDGDDTDRLSAGDSIPSHLRVGIYHASSFDCSAPSGCSVDLDNVQVVHP
ncbi:MAG TPA: heparin lyase I family protein [Solirubrobacterales bacterium]|nr:heparin lyase I family protein [Solirubrobacterales bacterium]